MINLTKVKKDLLKIVKALTSTRKMKLFSFWLSLMIIISISWVILGDVNNITVAISTLACGISTIIFWIYRKTLTQMVKKWNIKPSKKFILIGSLCALLAEFIFWFFEKLFNANGVAANPNLLIDYIVTMPWYILMIFLLWKVQNKYHYSLKEMILFGGIYELGGDGFIGSLLNGQLLSGFILGVIAIPLFVVVYSVIILPPTN